MTYKNRMTIYSLLLDTIVQTCYMLRIYMMFYMSVPPPFCFLFSQRDHNENKVYFWPVVCYPCHSILIVKLLDTYFVFL